MGRGIWPARYAGVCAVIGALALAGLAVCGRAVAEEPATRPAAVTATMTAPDEQAVQVILLPIGRSSVVQAPWPVQRVAVAEPKIADVQVLTPRQVLVSAKAVGSTDLLMWSKDEELRRARVDVEIDRAAIRAELERLFPGASLDVRQAPGAVVVTGLLRQAEDAQQLRRYMDGTALKYVDMTTLPGLQQVQIRVLVAEASRTAVRALGINAVATGNSAFGGVTIGPENGGPINPISIGVPSGAAAGHGVPFAFTNPLSVSPAATLFAGFPGKDLEIFVQALAENQYLRVLAEPNLVALSGQEASFLAGGEFPIPIVQGGGGAGGGTSISIEYKEFGVRLRFRPTVLGDGAIRLHVAPEVSELSNGPGSVQIQGFNIPAILTRRAETTLELNSGQTFGIAGLISESTTARTSRVPVVGDLPVLGSLFRSVRYQSGDTELVVLVTASLAEPTSVVSSPKVPGADHLAPSDWELYVKGRIEGKSAAKLSPTDSRQLKRLGLDQLKGPGAWANPDTPAAASSASLAAAPATQPARQGPSNHAPSPAAHQ